MKKFILLILLAALVISAGTVNFGGKTLLTTTYGGTECVTLAKFAEGTVSRMVWVPEKKKAVLVYNSHTYVFTANNRTVVVDNTAGIHLPQPVAWDGVNLYIPVSVLSRIFNVQPSELKPAEEIKIEKIILSGSDPTRIQILASGPISCDVIERSGSSVTLKVPVRSEIKEIAPKGLVKTAALSNGNDKTTIDLKFSRDVEVSSKGIANGVEVSFVSKSDVVVVQPTAKKKMVIVIDPGHGGKDPGAIGRKYGTREKTVALDTGLRLKKLLEAQGHTVYMTRTTDKYVPLQDRTKYANGKKADLFISIHYNANNSSSPNGFETYFLGSHRLEYAKNVALRENASLKYDIGENAYDANATLNDIIATLLTNRFQKESEELAGYIQEAGVAKTGFKNRGLNQAGFYVLKGCSMPAVLLECGFLTNSTEENKIRQSSYRQKIAEGIAKGVSSYVSSL